MPLQILNLLILKTLKMAELGIFAEIYPQIMSIYDAPKAKIELTYNRRGRQRAINYWNRRKNAGFGHKNFMCYGPASLYRILNQSILGAVTIDSMI